MSMIKRRALPAGWYPESAEKTSAVLENWASSSPPACSGAVACVVPHAGWEFSGELAFSAIRCLKTALDTVVIIGGHLPALPTLLISRADSYETPLGYLEADQRLIEALLSCFASDEDKRADNSVEIQLPIVKYLFPEARVVCMRVSPTSKAEELGKRLKQLATELDRKLVVIGSTDLTHYGPSYGFMPAGTGRGAVEWAREKNDRPLLEFLLRMNGTAAMRHATKQRSACSAGAAATAAAFAKEAGVKEGTLLGYRMSCDLYPAESFVGYGAIAYVPDERAR